MQQHHSRYQIEQHDPQSTYKVFFQTAVLSSFSPEYVIRLADTFCAEISREILGNVRWLKRNDNIYFETSSNTQRAIQATDKLRHIHDYFLLNGYFLFVKLNEPAKEIFILNKIKKIWEHNKIARENMVFEEIKEPEDRMKANDETRDVMYYSEPSPEQKEKIREDHRRRKREIPRERVVDDPDAGKGGGGDFGAFSYRHTYD